MRQKLGGLTAMVLLLAACGGGGGPSKADYVRAANAVCRASATQVSALRLPGPDDAAGLPRIAAQVVAAQRQALDRLRAIKPPKPDRTTIAKWIALVDQTIDQADISAQAQHSGDIARALTANANGAALDRRADEIARSFGLRMCVQASTAPDTTTTTTGAPS